jgi:hypothetical protein
MLDVSFFLLGLNVNHRLGNGDGPAWLPAGAVAGVDYTQGQAWLFDTLITDLTTIHGNGPIPALASFDPAAITAAGMAVTEANTNRPCATGAFADVFLACDFCVMFEWDQLAYPTGIYGVFVHPLENGGDADEIVAQHAGELSGDTLGAATWTDANNGEFKTAGIVDDNAHNKIAASANAAGWLTSLNGAAASLDSPVTPTLTGVPVFVSIGCRRDGSRVLNGTIRRVIFYPNEQNAAFVEALSALA